MLKKVKNNQRHNSLAVAALIAVIITAVYAGYYLNSQTKNASVYPVRKLANLWGEPAKEMFIPIDKPHYGQGDFLHDDDKVIMYQKSGNTYIYPLMIVGHHHIVNDIVDGQPLAITFCMLSNTAAIFRRNISGNTLSFGVLGSLYFGNLVMFDRETDSYWLQMTGEAINGKYKGRFLTMENAPVVFWKNIKNLAGLNVLQPEKDLSFYRKFAANYARTPIGINSLNGKTTLDPRLAPFETGIGLIEGGRVLFYPLSKLGNLDKFIDKSGKVSLEFSLLPSGFFVINKPVFPFGKREANYVLAYWYSWSALFPQTKIYSTIAN